MILTPGGKGHGGHLKILLNTGKILFSDTFDIQIHLIAELQISLLNIFPHKAIRFPFF